MRMKRELEALMRLRVLFFRPLFYSSQASSESEADESRRRLHVATSGLPGSSFTVDLPPPPLASR